MTSRSALLLPPHPFVVVVDYQNVDVVAAAVAFAVVAVVVVDAAVIVVSVYL